jgi:hypothetical protein
MTTFKAESPLLAMRALTAAARRAPAAAATPSWCERCKRAAVAAVAGRHAGLCAACADLRADLELDLSRDHDATEGY